MALSHLWLDLVQASLVFFLITFLKMSYITRRLLTTFKAYGNCVLGLWIFITISELSVNTYDEQQATAQCTWECWDCLVYNFTSTSKVNSTLWKTKSESGNI